MFSEGLFSIDVLLLKKNFYQNSTKSTQVRITANTLELTEHYLARMFRI